MSEMLEIGDDRPTDDLMLDSYATTESALLDPDEPVGIEQSEWTGVRCEKCDEPFVSDAVSICTRCGWYASLGSCRSRSELGNRF